MNIFVKNAVLFGIVIILSVVLTIIVTGFSWSFTMFSNILTYLGIAVIAHGTYIASNMSKLFEKKDLNKKYVKENDEKYNEKIKKKLKIGWVYILTGVLLLIVSVIAIKL